MAHFVHSYYSMKYSTTVINLLSEKQLFSMQSQIEQLNCTHRTHIDRCVHIQFVLLFFRSLFSHNQAQQLISAVAFSKLIKNTTCWNFSAYCRSVCSSLSFSLARLACSPLIWYGYIHQMLFVVKLAISMPSMGCTTTTESYGKITLATRAQPCTDG